MLLTYARQEYPTPDRLDKTPSIFLAGPTPRSDKVVSWRIEALKLLEKFGYDGYVFIPENADDEVFNENNFTDEDFRTQVEWEEKGLRLADCIMFWVPRNMETLPGLTTNIEFGRCMRTGRVVLGAPKEAQHMRYIFYYCEKLGISTAYTLEETVRLAIDAAKI